MNRSQTHRDHKIHNKNLDLRLRRNSKDPNQTDFGFLAIGRRRRRASSEGSRRIPDFQRSGTTPSLPTCGAELHTGVLACLHAWLHASTRMLFARAFFRTLTSGFLACFPCRPRKKSKRWASIKTFFSPAGKETPVASASSTTTAPVVSSDCQNPPHSLT